MTNDGGAKVIAGVNEPVPLIVDQVDTVAVAEWPRKRPRVEPLENRRVTGVTDSVPCELHEILGVPHCHRVSFQIGHARPKVAVIRQLDN
jgi:hypothetical protein